MTTDSPLRKENVQKRVRSDHWRRGGRGKPKIPLDQVTAEHLADNMTMRLKCLVQAYVCRVCRHWHVGRVPEFPAGTRGFKDHTTIRVFNDLAWELGTRVAGCLQQENHRDRYKAKAHLRAVILAAQRPRVGVVSRPDSPRAGKRSA